MLNIEKTTQDGVVTLALEGRLDANAAADFGAAVDALIGDAAAFQFDFTKLEYLSSAGLRIMMTTQQTMKKTGCADVTVRGASETIREIFAITGFDNILNIQ